MGEDTKLLLKENEVAYRREEMLQQHRDRLAIDGPTKMGEDRLTKRVQQYEKALKELVKMREES